MRPSLSQVYKVIQDAVIDTDDMLATNKIIYSQSHVEPAYTASQFIPFPIAAYIGDTRNSSVSMKVLAVIVPKPLHQFSLPSRDS